MCTSGFDEEAYAKNKSEDEEEEVAEIKKLQKYTSQQWLEEIENRYFDERDDLVRQSFQAALNDVQEPYSFLLHIIYRASFDLYSKIIPITYYYALDEFDIWLDLIEEKMVIMFVNQKIIIGTKLGTLFAEVDTIILTN